MEPTQFFAASQVFIVAGKGGVGKTVVAAALARAAAAAGQRTLVVGVERRRSLARLFGDAAWSYEPSAVGRGVEGIDEIEGVGTEGIDGAEIGADEALLGYLSDHGLHRIAKHMSATGLVEVIATTTPGIKDLLVLGRIKQLAANGAYDTIVVDAPAAGHAISFLSAARSLHDLARVGPIRAQAADVLDMLRTPTRAQVLLVTLPEETPVNELVETAFQLEDRVGVSLGPVVVNGLWPSIEGLRNNPAGATASLRERLRAAGDYWQQQVDQQRTQVERLARELPVPQLHLERIFADPLAPRHVGDLARSLTAEVHRLAD